MTTTLIVTSVISAVAAGTTATLATVLIEKLGGPIGGVLASSPSTIVIFAIATATTADSEYDLITTLYFSAVGLFGDAVFLWLWRELPSKTGLLQHAHFRSRWRQAIAMTVATIGFWMVYAISLIFACQALLNVGTPNRVIGALFWGANVAFGLYTVLYRYMPPPRLERHTSRLAYLGRFALGAFSIGVSIGISSISAVAGGIGSMFPNTFLASMVTLWIMHGAELPHSAIGPLMLGSVSSPFYAAVFGELLPYMTSAIGTFVPALVVTAVVAEAAAIAVISIPAYHIVKWRTAKARNEMQEDEDHSKVTTSVNTSSTSVNNEAAAAANRIEAEGAAR